MQNPMLMHLPLKGDLIGYDRDGTFTATASGPVRWKPRAGGTINYLTNPSVETALNVGGCNWRDDSVNDTVTRDTTTAYSGSASAKCVTVGGGAFSGIQIIQSGLSLNGESAAVASAYVAGAGATLNGCFWRVTYSDASFYSSPVVPITLTDAWTRVVMPGTPDAAKTITALTIFLIQPATGNVAQTFWADAAQFEYGTSDATPYIDGDSENCAWINLNTYMPGTAHASASAEVEYFAEEATTNLVPNPRAATATTYWGATTTGVTIARSTADGVTALTCFEAVCDGLNINQGIGMTTLAALVSGAGVVVTGSAFVRIVSGSPTLEIEIVERDSGGAFLTSSRSVIAATTAWKRFTKTYTTVNASCFAVQLRVLQPTGGAGVAATFRITDAQIEQKAYATSYCEGSLGTGYTWAGTAHASASSRAASYLTIDLLDRIGTIIGSTAMRVNAPDNTTAAVLLNVGTFGTDDWLQVNVNYAGTGNPPRIIAKTDAGATTTLASASSVTGDTETALYAEWQADALGITALGEAITSGARPTPDGVTSGNMLIGTSSTTQQPNGSISDVVIFNRPLTDAERAVLAATDDWTVEMIDHLQPRFGGVMRLGPSIGLAVSSVAAPAAIAIARAIGEL